MIRKEETIMAASITTKECLRHKCSACYKQYKKKEHLIEHMRVSYHSVHQPRCGVCQKHCKSFESLREHLNGPLSKSNCSKIFLEQGCGLCLRVLDDRTSLSGHQDICRLTAPVRQGTSLLPTDLSDCYDEDRSDRGLGAIAMDCVMAGGGSDGTLDICIGICLVDEDEKLIFNTFVQPQIPITNYRHEVTGLTEERVRYAMPLKEVQEKVLKILLNGETIERLRLNGGKARLLVGHDLEHDLDCLRMNYPDHMLRDTARYTPLMKTNLVSHSLKYLTRTYLGYDIRQGVHDPYENCVSAMRLYKRMRSLNHHGEVTTPLISPPPARYVAHSLDSYSAKDLEKMTPDTLYELSRSNFKCWCLDSRRVMQT
ncbi:uncharacterized protein LOC111795196 isoform X1 [Cucurbita pepo subsp. pepo]|uniref:uncharacterized protein LOC111795196 isoform X1 n=2 Tax=Cucurbita pepo subsp. pepo TaxID=3664 RepID=UPI000C9D5E16|nr:uncharacterized protein LOC111795196 isoform X1 [Cucurbita pepo subsp. pepo]XP_023533249.1 uncharacterized protein LOC111795196 isoform X1 [Cucurbita pepo subsp. pepo]XP_023533250.1 uncharacterized protein LOC111795196 isoform X1 [Cucurbita pepo subsp. pepo]